MRVALIAVGSELLNSGRRDTNADWIGERVMRAGAELASRTIVGDGEGEIVAVLREALSRADAVILTGGLGPTEDDRTRDALARALERPLVPDPAVEAWLREMLGARGIPVGPEQLRQAGIPSGGTWIDNPLGSARGIRVDDGERMIFALAGVPAEMRATFDNGVGAAIAQRGGGVARRTLKIAGRMESSVDRQLRPLYERHDLSVTILLGREGIELHLLARAADRAQALSRIEAFDREACELLGQDLFGRDDVSLPTVIGEALAGRGETLSVAESCTAGMLASEIASVPGASAWFRGGLVVYEDRLKIELAGVAAEVLGRHGAVSRPVGEELAQGVRTRLGTQWGIGITGIAGPGGGSPDKPVGRVHIAWAHAAGVEALQLDIVGDRSRIRRRSVLEALDGLRRRLTRSPDP